VESSIMSSSRWFAAYFAGALLCGGATAHAGNAGIGCPPTHDGKRLKDVKLFDGLPANKIEVIPEPGRFVVPQTPRSQWQKFPPSMLGCTYADSKDMVAVELPRYIRVCDFPHYPQVKCH
jgi:hypothetical protein